MQVVSLLCGLLLHKYLASVCGEDVKSVTEGELFTPEVKDFSIYIYIKCPMQGTFVLIQYLLLFITVVYMYTIKFSYFLSIYWNVDVNKLNFLNDNTNLITRRKKVDYVTSLK
jgi:hypothetical protein